LAKRQSATSLEISPEQERRTRMIKYTVAMSVRMVCIILGVFTQGWLMWVFFSFAIFLPYFAVIIANAQGPTGGNYLSKVVAPKLSVKAQDIRIVDDPN
jgi:predicted tellurium resistance membrane protein TerC